MTPHQPAQLSCSAHAGQAGFTLVELMVAMTGGLFLSIVVFALSRDASRFYQSETRAANATLAGVSGFERLSSDIARAGHLTTPNITGDPRVCNPPLSTWPDLLEKVRAVRVDTTHAQVTGSEVDKAGLTPMAIELAGALQDGEELAIAHFGTAAAGGFEATLRPDWPAAARLGLREGVAFDPANLAILQRVFLPSAGNGRAVRLVQLDGLEQYGLVTAVQVNPTWMITLAAVPALVFRDEAAGAVQCGFRGFNTGAYINVINFVRYELRPMTGVAAYASLFAASTSAGLPYEGGRVELVREELKPDGTAMPGTLEIVSEYAVDLQFGPLQANSAMNPALIAPAAASLDEDYNATQLLRSMHVRLSVRSREADRQAPVSGMPAGDLYRIGLGAGGSGNNAPYARVRTFQADIPLRNLEGANW